MDWSHWSHSWSHAQRGHQFVHRRPSRFALAARPTLNQAEPAAFFRRRHWMSATEQTGVAKLRFSRCTPVSCVSRFCEVDLWGRLSNPVQRRLSEGNVQDLVRSYAEGSSIDQLARRFSVHRTTVISHLDRRGVPRRRIVRKLTDRDVKLAADQYWRGQSLKEVAEGFAVDARTLAREFSRAGIATRPRRGWPPIPPAPDRPGGVPSSTA